MLIRLSMNSIHPVIQKRLGTTYLKYYCFRDWTLDWSTPTASVTMAKEATITTILPQKTFPI